MPEGPERVNGRVLSKPFHRKENEMSIFSAISRLAAEYSEARARYLTERQVRSLPPEIQKDIGWPDAYERRPARYARSSDRFA